MRLALARRGRACRTWAIVGLARNGTAPATYHRIRGPRSDHKGGRTLMGQLFGTLAKFLAQTVDPVAAWPAGKAPGRDAARKRCGLVNAIHPSAWKMHSANFPLWRFSKVRVDQ